MRRCSWMVLLLTCAACATEVVTSLPPAPADADAGLDAAAPPEDAASDTGDIDAASDTSDIDAELPDAAPPDAASPDADLPDADLPDAAPAEDRPARYDGESLRSPVSRAVVERMEAIRAAGPAQDDLVFMKVGASGTVSPHLLTCFGGAAPYRIALEGREALEDTIAFFRMGDAAGTTPFERQTEAAEVGRTARWAITGSPSPLERELEALRPRFAVINYGTNDMNQGSTFGSALPGFYESMASLLDQVEGAGVIPILTGLNPREAEEEASRWVPVYNAVTWGLAEQRQVPWINLFQATVDLPERGLLSDGLHGNVYREGGVAQPCVFDAEGLRYNYNVRNLLTLEALDDARRTVLEGAEAPDDPGPALQGAGTAADPWVIDRLPFTHSADTATAPLASAWGGYPSCDRGQDESGPEAVYRLEVAAPQGVRFIVLDRGAVDIDMHLLRGAASPEACVSRHDRQVQRRLEAGVWYVVLDTFASGGVPRAGGYLLAVVPCEADDPECLEP